MRILHVISELSTHEAMGRTIAETVAHVPGEHHLLATRIHDGAELFASTHVVGGSLSWFAFTERGAVEQAIATVQPDVIHLHGGGLTPLWAKAPAFAGQRLVQTVYGWPRLPGPRSWRHATISQMRTSNVLRARVAATSVLPPALARRLVRSSGTAAILSPDPDARARLEGCGATVMALPSGATADGRRARFRAERPVVLFAGRAETVRGIDTVLDALPLVQIAHPSVRLRLLLIPTPELPAVLARIEAAGLGDAVEVVTEPVADLTAELAAAQVGTWPFKFDYTTSPPAMAVAEAMAVGLPVVSTPVACVRSVATEGHGAHLVPVGDHRALASAINSLLGDEAHWQEQADAGVRVIERSSGWEAAAAVTIAAYDTATRGSWLGRQAHLSAA